MSATNKIRSTSLRYSFMLGILGALLFVRCGSSITPATLPPIDRNQDLGALPLKGIFPTSDGGTIDLQSDSTIPQILFFASEGCDICNRETDNLVAEFSRNGGLPTNVKIYTVLAGSNPADAARWKRVRQVTWIVGADLDATLFLQYCPEFATPCIILRNPATSTKKLIGEHSLKDFQDHTGIWSY